jgi:DNA-binding IclR family transcriptional regulator
VASEDSAGPAQEKPDSVDLIDKLNAVLTALQIHGQLSAAELAEQTGIPLSSMFRLLVNFVDIGLVDKSVDRGRYRLGLRCATIGAALEDQLSLHQTAYPVLEELRRSSDSTAFLEVRSGYESVCVERISGPGVRILAMRLGSSLPLYMGGASASLLAGLVGAQQAEVLDHFERLGKRDLNIPTRSQLEYSIARDRKRGYSTSDGDVLAGTAAVGAPVLDHRGNTVAAVSVSGMRSAIMGDLPRKAELVMAAAAAISESLGYHPSVPSVWQTTGACRDAYPPAAGQEVA